MEEFSEQNIVEKLDEVDRLSIELANEKRLRVRAEAEKALAKNETAELAYKYTIFQIYVKYGLNESDAIDQGKIIRGGAKSITHD